MARILFIPGSLRARSSSRATARSLARLVAGDTEIAEIGQLPHYNADLDIPAAVTAFKERIARADGIVFVTPEYNYSVPGVLKNAIDWASRPAFESVLARKPCLVVTVSGGAMGGVRAQGHLKYVLAGVMAQVHASKEILVPRANDKVVDGYLEDAAILDFAAPILADFVAAAGAAAVSGQGSGGARPAGAVTGPASPG